MSEFFIEVIKHSTVSNYDTIIRLKMQYWPYSYESHEQWIRNNTYPNDRHIFLTHNNKLIGYTCLPSVICIVDYKRTICNGIGSICIDKDKQNMGWGSMILQFAKCISKTENKALILRCHDTLVPFYKVQGFNEHPMQNCLIDNVQDDQHLFVYGLNIESSSMVILDRKF